MTLRELLAAARREQSTVHQMHLPDGSRVTTTHSTGPATNELIARASQLAAALIEVREMLSRLSRWLDTDAEILADLSDAAFADHHHICGEIAAALASIDAIMEGEGRWLTNTPGTRWCRARCWTKLWWR